jgi:predicted ABC-type sugar transport system permease subunit
MADKEIALERNEPAEVEKQADKSKKGTDGIRPPLLIEFTVMLAAIILVAVFFTIVGISLLNGTSLLNFVIRTSISILVLGSLLLIITRQISSGMSSTEKAKEPNKADELDMQSPSEVN